MTAIVERFRPKAIANLRGQPEVVESLSRFVASPHPEAFVFEGDTGIGKTSAALSLAGELGCDLAMGDLGGVFQIASGEHSADAIREMYDRLWYTTFGGSGWKVLIVNEAERMSPQAETVWLDRLEKLPPQTVVVFTTNNAGRLPQRFLDRCRVLKFRSSAADMAKAACEYAVEIMQGLGLQLDARAVADAVAGAIVDGRISLRRVARHFERFA